MVTAPGVLQTMPFEPPGTWATAQYKMGIGQFPFPHLAPLLIPCLLHSSFSFSMSYVEGSTSPMEDQQGDCNIQQSPSQVQSALVQAWQRWKIAELEGKLEVLKSGHAVKESYDGHCMY
jgi:hypothetical protein